MIGTTFPIFVVLLTLLLVSKALALLSIIFFFNTLAMGAFESCAFGTSISDHCAIQFTITMGVLSQTILRNRSMTQLPDDFRFPEALPHAVCDLDSRFRSLLTKGDVSGSSKLTMVPIC